MRLREVELQGEAQSSSASKEQALDAKRCAARDRRQAVEGVDEDVARIRVHHLVIAELERRDAAADTDVEPPVAEMVEDAYLFRKPQRRIERQEIDKRP